MPSFSSLFKRSIIYKFEDFQGLMSPLPQVNQVSSSSRLFPEVPGGIKDLRRLLGAFLDSWETGAEGVGGLHEGTGWPSDHQMTGLSYPLCRQEEARKCLAPDGVIEASSQSCSFCRVQFVTSDDPNIPKSPHGFPTEGWLVPSRWPCVRGKEVAEWIPVGILRSWVNI